MSDLHSEVHIAMYSESDNPTIVTYACGQVKDKLVEDREFKKKCVNSLILSIRIFITILTLSFVSLQDWKNSKGQMGQVLPKFVADADLSGITNPTAPALKMCNLSPNGHLSIPREIRDRWLADPVRSVMVSIFTCFFDLLANH